MSKNKKLEIKSRWPGATLYTEEAESLKDLVCKAIANKADLSGAYLSGADLRSADLRSAYLSGADLSGADLSGADLSGADLSGAYLSGADLRSADLSGAYLRSADLSGADLPSPTIVLLASWGNLSAQLRADLMLFDAENHPDPAAFDRWAAGGSCPYDGVKVQRAAHFSESRELWGKGVHCRPYDLMTRVLAECCPEWTEEQRAEFAKKFEGMRKK